MKKILKALNFIFVSILFLLPISAQAATHNIYSVSTDSFSTADVSRSYNIGYGNTYKFTKTYFHQITDGDTKILAHCLDDGLHAPSGASGKISSSDTATLYNKGGSQIQDWQLNILKNIMAASYQYSGNVSSLTTASPTIKKNVLATQILVWEVMDGVRSDYSTSNYNSASPNTYDFVKTDSELQTIYENILSNASKLAGNNKPSSFGKTYILHWDDNKEAYTLNGDISIGEYRIDSFDSSKLTAEISNTVNSQNYISITSKNEITTPQTVKLKFSKGSTLNDANRFRWFTFNSSSGNQKLVLGYYQGSASGELSVKTESGKFTITKKDSTTNKNLKGAVFELDRCKKITSCEKFKTIDMKNKAVSDEIEVNKSGWYRLRETTVPFGYEKMEDVLFLVSIQDDGKVKLSINQNYNFITQDENNNLVVNMNVKEDAKNFQIKKIDGRTNEEIKGATFQIKKSDNTVVKFVKEADGKYRYDENGTVTSLVSTNLSSYTIALLPEGEYILEELSVPYPYVLASKQIERETKFKIDKTDYLQTYNYTSNTYIKSSDVTITVKNYKTRVTIIKTGLKSKPVQGVTFELYDSNKNSQIPVRIENGEYIYNKNGTPIQLVTDAQGQIVINYLPGGTYYLKEIKTPDDSGLAIDPNNQWTEIKVYVNRSSATPYNYRKEVRNAKGSFCFYKIDVDCNYLDSGKFILQMYNEKTSKYDDKPLIFNSDKTYSIDTTNKSDIYTFSPISEGQTCFVDVDVKGKYRVVEIEAPEGFVLPKSSETQAEITINEYGYATGDAVIINKKINVGEGAEAQAELIINIQTGQTRIHYIIIIIAIISLIMGLLIFKKKIDKK